MFPTSVSPARFQEGEEDEDEYTHGNNVSSTSIDKSISVATDEQRRQNYEDGIIANSYPLDRSRSMMTSNRSDHIPKQQPGSTSEHAATSSSSQPPVYNPIVPSISTSSVVDHTTHPTHVDAFSISDKDRGIISSSIVPHHSQFSRFDTNYNGDDQTVTNRRSSSSASAPGFTPEERARLQKILDTQQKKERASTKKPGYWGMAWSKRRDIGKLVMLAFVILFALAVHAAAVHYIGAYIETSADYISFWVELALRIGYPVLVLIVLWILKVHLSSAAAMTTENMTNRSVDPLHNIKNVV